MKPTALLLAFFIPCPILAVVKNHTIDDTSPLVTYTSPPTCIGCGDGFASDVFDTSQLFDGTVTSYGGIPANSFSIEAIEFNFTGTAVYIFVAAPSVPDDQVEVGPLAFSQSCSFVLDGANIGPSFSHDISVPSNGQYNILAYANTAIADGAHTFQIQLSSPGNGVNFDFAIYSSLYLRQQRLPGKPFRAVIEYKLNVDPESSSSLLDSTSASRSRSTLILSDLLSSSDIASSTATTSSTSGSAAASNTPSTSPPKAKPPISLIIGITAGSATLIIAFLIWRWVHRNRDDSGEVEEIQWPLFRSSSPTDNAPNTQADGLNGPYSMRRQQDAGVLLTQPRMPTMGPPLGAAMIPRNGTAYAPTYGPAGPLLPLWHQTTAPLANQMSDPRMQVPYSQSHPAELAAGTDSEEQANTGGPTSSAVIHPASGFSPSLMARTQEPRPRQREQFPGDAYGPSVPNRSAISPSKLTMKQAEIAPPAGEAVAPQSTSVPENTSSVSRSLSMMKVEQTHIVQEHQNGYTASDELVDTDRGLQLTPKRLNRDSERPPSYREG
ncbi:hypothetical protein C8R44DRAFT_856770 [Mycena epipterygia]|nr:hypothetical protein C8R44DRAFT_856770 [Mycena epipterygia]